METTGQTVTKVTFIYDEAVDSIFDIFESKGIKVYDSKNHKTIVNLKPKFDTYEELILALLEQLGYKVEQVENEYRGVAGDESTN